MNDTTMNKAMFDIAMSELEWAEKNNRDIYTSVLKLFGVVKPILDDDTNKMIQSLIDEFNTFQSNLIRQINLAHAIGGTGKFKSARHRQEMFQHNVAQHQKIYSYRIKNILYDAIEKI